MFADVKSENLGQGEKADFYTVKASVVFLRKENCMYQVICLIIVNFFALRNEKLCSVSNPSQFNMCNFQTKMTGHERLIFLFHL